LKKNSFWAIVEELWVTEQIRGALMGKRPYLACCQYLADIHMKRIGA
jgi:hypothetical protein